MKRETRHISLKIYIAVPGNGANRMSIRLLPSMNDVNQNFVFVKFLHIVTHERSELHGFFAALIFMHFPGNISPGEGAEKISILAAVNITLFIGILIFCPRRSYSLIFLLI